MKATLALTCAAFCASVLAAPAVAVADPGGPQLDRLRKRAEQLQSLHISEQEEIRLGEAVSENIRIRYGVVQDPAVHRYVSLVGTLLAQEGPRPNLP